MNSIMMEQIYTASVGAISAILAWIKLNILGVVLITDIPTISITWMKIFEVVLCAAIGALVGLGVREIWSYGKKLIKKCKHER